MLQPAEPSYGYHAASMARPERLARKPARVWAHAPGIAHRAAQIGPQPQAPTAHAAHADSIAATRACRKAGKAPLPLTSAQNTRQEPSRAGVPSSCLLRTFVRL